MAAQSKELSCVIFPLEVATPGIDNNLVGRVYY